MNNFNKLKGILIGASLATGLVSAPAALAGKNYNNSCTQYRLSAYGGDAGFRLMNNSKNFRKTSNGSIVGKICNSGRVKVELSKRHPNTHVSLEVNGYEYVFGQGDRGDRHANNWFRRYVHVDLPKHSGHHGGHRNNHDPYNTHGGGRGNDYGPSPSNGHGYGHNNNYGYGNNYDPYENHGSGYGDSHGYNDSANRGHHLSNGHGYNAPEYFRAHSKRHRKAHRRGIPHSHQGQYFAYQ